MNELLPKMAIQIVVPSVLYENVSLPWMIICGQMAQAYREAADNRTAHRIRALRKRYGKERVEKDMATATYSFKGVQRCPLCCNAFAYCSGLCFALTLILHRPCLCM